MKRIVSVFIFFLCVMVAMAQELSVKSFTLDLTDLSASTESRTSINGDLCALVKVYLAVSDATFQGNIVGDVVHNVNQYWVYMPSGSKKLQINHPNYLPLDVAFADYGINRLESKQTYVLVVNLPEQVPSQPADTGGSFVSLVVKPENAVVSIDGKSLSVEATGQYMSMLSYGQHSYQVECGGYVTKSGTFDIKRGSTTELNVSLVSALATLTISCPTAGASLYIDKKSVGSLPWTGTLQEGMHLIEAKKEGHRDVQKSVTLAQQQKITVSLDALTPILGNLSVAYRPIGADIYIDGKKSGTSPYVFNGILVGSHKVEIRKDGYASETKSVTIKEGETATLQGNLNALASASSSSSSSSSSATVSNGSTSEQANQMLQERMTKRQEANNQRLYGANREAGEKFLAENKTKEGVITLPSGLQYKVITMGTGAKPTAQDKVEVDYEGTLIDGTVFDSSYKRGKAATFGVTQVIKGWTEALQLMPAGSKWELYIPYQLAYGERQSGKDIKPYSVLIFTVELKSIVEK